MRALSLARITLLQLTFLTALHGRTLSFVNALTVACLDRRFRGCFTQVKYRVLPECDAVSRVIAYTLG